MGYIGRRMSVNADAAYKKGLLPRSRFTKKILNENGWLYSVSFFKWLCKQGIITPLEYHHTTPMAKCTPFYAISTISYAIHKYDLVSIYQVYLHKSTMRDVLRKKGAKRVRILVSRTLMHTGDDVYLDCIQYNQLYWWSKTQCFKIDSNSVALIKTYALDDFNGWFNPNREKLERQIYIYKNIYRRPLNS